MSTLVVEVKADTSALVTAVRRATKAAKKLKRAFDAIESAPITLSVESA